VSLRLCLDLNIFVADILAEAAGRRDTAAQALVRVAAKGRWAGCLVHLVISVGMLDRLEAVLVRRLDLPPGLAATRREIIAGFARHGPTLTLGGTGLVPLRDVEDAHVLETALSGAADWLVTANLRDYASPARARTSLRPLDEGLVVVDAPDRRRLFVVEPRIAAGWLRDPAAVPVPS
jgi:predicted nucleic acid-binding protein